jgi:hypothetical protein
VNEGKERLYDGQTKLIGKERKEINIERENGSVSE